MSAIRRVKKEQYEVMAEIAQDKSYYVGELDGSDIQTGEDFLDAVWDVFKFPIGHKSIHGYRDWICDLSWLNAEGYVFAILNYRTKYTRDL